MKIKAMTLAIIFTLVFVPFLKAEADQAKEQKETVEIQGPGVEPKIVAPQKIEAPEGAKIPEIPKPRKESGLSEQQKVRMSLLDQKYSEGKINQSQYDLEKDKITRDSNIKF